MSLKLPSAEQWLFAANILADKLFFRQNFDSSVKKILIVKWDEIGDMAAATHVFRLLRRDYPEAHITLLCKPFVRSLIEHDPHLSSIITDISAYNSRHDLVIELRGTWQTLFKSIFYKAKYRVGRAAVRAKNKGHQLHETDTNSAIIQPVVKNKIENQQPVLYCSAEDEKIVGDYLTQNEIKKFAVFHVGARRILRQWPLGRFAEIADYLHTRFQMDIVFAGTAEDTMQIDQVRKLLNFESYIFTDGYSLSQLTALCRKAAFYIGNESGPLQIASVCRVPLVGIFGPGVPHVFYPQGENSKVVHHILQCNPCNQIDCVEPQNPCINRVTVMEVIGEINAIDARINLKM